MKIRFRYGVVTRCDIPYNPRGDRYAFLEYDSAGDAEEAYRRMHSRRLRCGVIKVEVQHTSLNFESKLALVVG